MGTFVKVPQWGCGDKQFGFIGDITRDDVHVLYQVNRDGPFCIELQSYAMRVGLEWEEGSIGVCDLNSLDEVALPDNLCHFEAEWLEFFRPRCWLSGADVEATAHEKAEWMKGFSREELEAWNLTM